VETSGSTPRSDGDRQFAADDVGRDAPPPAGSEPAPVTAAPGGTGQLVGYLAIYTVLRLGLITILTVLLAFFMPLIVALLFAIIVQLPLSWLLFAGPRRRVNEAIARSSARRRAERARLQSALSGDEPER
jgi:hypothetical protein